MIVLLRLKYLGTVQSMSNFGVYIGSCVRYSKFSLRTEMNIKTKLYVRPKIKFLRIMKFVLVLFVILLRDPVAIFSNDESGYCFQRDQNGKALQFFCSNTQILFNETCTNSTLSGAMQSLNSSVVTELKISGCGINELSFALEHLDDVKNLDISYSKLGYSDVVAFNIPVQNEILKINMSHSNLTEIPSKIFDKTPHLQAVDLSHNQLKWLPLMPFEKALELMDLNLNHNRLLGVLYYNFTHLTKLECIDLSNNFISHTNDFLFPKSVKVIHVENNPIRRFPCGSFSDQWMHLAKVFVSWNEVITFDIKCIKDRIQLVIEHGEFIEFRNGKFEVYCGPRSLVNLETILSRSDQMTDLHKFAYATGPTLQSLQTLDVSGSSYSTEFEIIDWRANGNLKKLCISNSNLRGLLHPEVLQSLTLTHFDASGNRIENANEIIRHLNPSMKKLDLSGNPIGELHADMFKKLKNLEVLRLNNTNISIGNFNPFDQLKHLKELDVSNNNLRNANVTLLLSTLANLRLFAATDCRIMNALGLINSFGQSIREISLSGNAIGRLSANTFNKMENLWKLSVSNTNLTIIGTDPFAPLRKLTWLDVSYNDLSNVNFTMFSLTLDRLLFFYAIDCKIMDATDIIKSCGYNLMRLDLSNNFIGNLDPAVFDKFNLLELLILRNTNLQFLDPEFNPYIVALHEFDISYNNFSSFDFTKVSFFFRNLRSFEAAGCQIRNANNFLKQFGSYIFSQGVSDISRLDLSENPIEELNFDKIETFGQLNELHLSNTVLMSFNFSELEQNEQLNLLNLSFNPMNELNISSIIPNLRILDLRGNGLSEIHNFNR